MKAKPEQLELWPSPVSPSALPRTPAFPRDEQLWVRNLASNLMRYRFKSNLTRRQLGKELRLSRSTIELIESGSANPSAYLIFKLSKFYNVSMDELVKDRFKSV